MIQIKYDMNIRMVYDIAPIVKDSKHLFGEFIYWILHSFLCCISSNFFFNILHHFYRLQSSNNNGELKYMGKKSYTRENSFCNFNRRLGFFCNMYICNNAILEKTQNNCIDITQKKSFNRSSFIYSLFSY